MGSYPSGQRDLTVNQLAHCLRRFESFTAHWINQPDDWLNNVHSLFKSLKDGNRPVVDLFAQQVALIAQLVEHVLGKNGVMGPSPIEGSSWD